MAYLSETEIEQYCHTIPGVTMTEVLIASELIDGFKGRTYELREVTEQVPLNKDRRGKLNHLPVFSIEKVIKKSRNNIFGVTEEELSPADIEIDTFGDGRFTYCGFGGLNTLVYGNAPSTLIITYNAGYAEYPERLKVACAMLAQNIKQKSSFGGEKSINSMDYRVEMTDDSFFTSDIKMLLRGL